MQQMAVLVKHGFPMNKVGTGGNVHKVLAPVHHIFAIYLGYYLTTSLHLSYYRARLGETLASLIAKAILKGVAMLGPVYKVATGGDTQTGCLMVPTGVGHHIESVLSHTYTWIFASAWGIQGRPFIIAWIKNRSAVMLKVQTILAECIANA